MATQQTGPADHLICALLMQASPVSRREPSSDNHCRSGRWVRLRARQRGAFMLEMSLALLISALAAVGVQREIIRTQVLRSADIEADNLKLYRQALQDYTDEFYDELQGALPVTKNGVNLASGAAEGQTMQPSVANLIAMGYLPAGFANASLLTDAGVFRNIIQRTPAGCAPAIACDITGLAYFDQPFVIRNSGGNTNGVVVGQMLTRIGGLAGTSMETNAATITGAGAGWTANNPVAGAPAGVVGVRFGVGTSVFQAYVRRNDPRDPNLLGPLTVAGATTLGANLAVAGNATVAGTLGVTGDTTLAGVTATGQFTSSADVGTSTVAGCLRAALRSGGELVSRAADCVTRVLVNNAGVSVNSATGATRLSLNGDTGVLQVNNNAGTARVSMDGDGLLQVNNGAGAAVITANGATGRLQAQTISATFTATRGTACTSNGDVAADAAASGTVLVCRNNVWRGPGLDQQTVGTACAVNGQLAMTAAGEALVCRTGTWFLLNDRLSLIVPMELFSGNGQGNVATPTCGVGGTVDIAVAALQGGSDYGGLPPRNRFEVRVSAPSGVPGFWTVSPVMAGSDGTGFATSFDGAAYNLGWTATTYCKYAS